MEVEYIFKYVKILVLFGNERKRTMNCQCGSGIPLEDCHNDNDVNKIRKSLRVRVLPEETTEDRVATFFSLAPQNFESASFRGTLKLQVTDTPAGRLLYPLFIKNANRCLRPITIDGQTFVWDEENEYVSIPCMLTPIHFGEITFKSKDIRRNNFLTGGLTVTCEIKTSGNPFDSVFAMEMKGEEIALYHHTSKENEQLIRESGFFKGSKWNLQGTNELTEVHYIYFTNIPKIEDSFDLFDIGMADKGTDLVIITDNGEKEIIEVYRDNPINRPAALKVWIDWNLISTNHLILHNDQASHLNPTEVGTYSWWEVFMPYIFRVPVKVNSNLNHTYNRKKNEYKLRYGPNFLNANGFLAALGSDLHGLRINWCEKRTPRSIARPSDFGKLDRDWVKVWENNFTRLVSTVLEKLLMKVNN